MLCPAAQVWASPTGSSSIATVNGAGTHLLASLFLPLTGNRTAGLNSGFDVYFPAAACGNDEATGTVPPSGVPEPRTWAMLASGLTMRNHPAHIRRQAHRPRPLPPNRAACPQESPPSPLRTAPTIPAPLYCILITMEIIFELREDDEGTLFARALGHAIFTGAASWEDRRRNVMKAVLLHYEDEPPCSRLIRLHYVKDELILLEAQ